MVDKTSIINSFTDLSIELEKRYRGTETANFVNETLIELKKSEGVAFTGCLQYFFNKAPVIKLSENIKLNDQEKVSWRKAFSYNDLGNNLWGANL